MFTEKTNLIKHSDVKSELILGKIGKVKPLVSIMIPTYKRGNTLKIAIDSALNQKNFSNYNVIVVDNNGNEKSEIEILIKMYNNSKLIYYKNKENIGLMGNWNRCIELAQGEWVTLLHDDDALHPQYLEFVSRQFNSGYGLIGCNIVLGESNKLEKFLHSEIDNSIDSLKTIQLQDFLIKNYIDCPGAIFKREYALNIGGFSEKYGVILDFDFWIRFSKSYSVAVYGKKMSFYRWEINMSQKWEVFKEVIENDIFIRRDLLDSLGSNKIKNLYYYTYGNVYKIFCSRKGKERKYLMKVLKQNSFSNIDYLIYDIFEKMACPILDMMRYMKNYLRKL